MSTAPIMRDQRPRVIYMSQSRKHLKTTFRFYFYWNFLIGRDVPLPPPVDWLKCVSPWIPFQMPPGRLGRLFRNHSFNFVSDALLGGMFLYFETMIGNMVFRLIKFWKTIVCFEIQRTKFETLTGWFLWKLFRKRKQE